MRRTLQTKERWCSARQLTVWKGLFMSSCIMLCYILWALSLVPVCKEHGFVFALEIQNRKPRNGIETSWGIFVVQEAGLKSLSCFSFIHSSSEVPGLTQPYGNTGHLKRKYGNKGRIGTSVLYSLVLVQHWVHYLVFTNMKDYLWKVSLCLSGSRHHFFTTPVFVVFGVFFSWFNKTAQKGWGGEGDRKEG